MLFVVRRQTTKSPFTFLIFGGERSHGVIVAFLLWQREAHQRLVRTDYAPCPPPEGPTVASAHATESQFVPKAPATIRTRLGCPTYFPGRALRQTRWMSAAPNDGAF